MAKSRLGDTNYDFITNNCQHFSVECRYIGVCNSPDVIETVKKIDEKIKSKKSMECVYKKMINSLSSCWLDFD